MIKLPTAIYPIILAFIIILSAGVGSFYFLVIILLVGFMIFISREGIKMTVRDMKKERSEIQINQKIEEVKALLISEKEREGFKFILEEEYKNFPDTLKVFDETEFDIKFLAERVNNFEENFNSPTENLVKNSIYFEDIGSVNLLMFELLSIFFIIRAIMLCNCVEPIIDKYLNTLSRKRKFLITKDDYGDYQFNDWYKELNYFYKSKIEKNLISFQNNLLSASDFLKTDYRKEIYLKTVGNEENLQIIFTSLTDGLIERKTKNKDFNLPEYYENMNGIQYENFIQNYFLNLGFNSQITKGSGDQGVDVLVEIEGKKIAIQCKHYNSSKIGNDSVQQVYSAKEFFDCDIAAVITNNEFTKQAKQLAEKLKVHLLHHEELKEFVKKIIFDND